MHYILIRLVSMKSFLIVGSLLLLSTSSFARDSYVRGYVRKDGTYVQGYHRTTPDNTVNNNYGTSGNLNPYTGESGRRPRNPSQGVGEYNQGNGQGNTSGHGVYGLDNQ